MVEETGRQRIPTLGLVVLGRVVVSLFLGPLVVGAVALLGWAMGQGIGFGTVVLVGMVTTLLSEVLLALCERPAVLRAQHPSPGGWFHAIWFLVVPPVVGFIVGWWLAPELALSSALAAGIVFWTLSWGTKPWRRVPSRADHQANWQAVRTWLKENEQE